MKVGFAKEAFFFWLLVAALLLSAVSTLYGYDMSNGPVFLAYMAVVFTLTSGRALRSLLRPSVELALVFGFFALAGISLHLQYQRGGTIVDRFGTDAYQYATTNLKVYVMYFMLGCMSVLPTTHFSKRQGVLAGILMLVVIAAVGGGVVDYAKINDTLNKDITQINVSQPIVVVSFLAVAYSSKYKALTTGLACAALFMLGSRTAFFVGASVLLGYITFRGGMKPRTFLVILFFLLLAAVVGLVVDVDNPLVARMLLASGLEQDSSFQSRFRQFEIGMIGLPEQVWLGDYTFVVRAFGGVGFYIHNVLGYWQQYGAPVFLVFVTLLLAICKNVFSKKMRDIMSASPGQTFLAMLLAYVVISLLTSMSYTFKIVWYAIGLYFMMSVYPGEYPVARGRKT